MRNAFVLIGAVLASSAALADFPIDDWQMRQVSEMFDGLQGHYQQGTQARMSRIGWLYRDQMADPKPLSVGQAQQLVRGCVHTGQSQMTRESINFFMTCGGKNQGIVFHVSDGSIVMAEISNPPPLIIVPNPADKK